MSLFMQCQICNHSKNTKSYKVKEMFYGFGETFDYFMCAKCGCLQIESIPKDIKKYYPNNYYSYQDNLKSHNKVKNYLIKLRNQFAVFNDNIIGKLLYKIFPDPAIRSLGDIQLGLSSSILDVGCGSGKLLSSLKGIGFNNILGIDPFNDEDIQYKNGLCIKKQNIYKTKTKYDVVMFHHSFEHMEQPLDVLKHTNKLLKQHGTCLIRIPTVSSYSWNHYKTNWVNLDAPRHFFLYSIESIKLLADKAGFEINSIKYDSTAFQFWGSEQYKKGIFLSSPNSYTNKENKKTIFTKTQIKDFEKKAKHLNSEKLGDQVVLYLTKK